MWSRLQRDRRELLLERFQAPDSQRYSERPVASVLSILPGPYGHGSIIDAWPEGEWCHAIVFHQGGRQRFGAHVST